jgi:hypothetical protein
MHKIATKCNKTQSKWFKNKHGASKIIDTFETYQSPPVFASAENTPRSGAVTISDSIRRIEAIPLAGQKFPHQ